MLVYLFPSKIWLAFGVLWMDEYVSHFGGIFLSNRGRGDLRSVHFQKLSKVGDDGSRDGGVVIFSLPSWKKRLHVTWVKISKHDWIPWILDILGCGSLGKFDEDIFSTSYHPGTLNNHFLILILNGCFNWIMKQTSTYRKWVDFPRLLGDKKGSSFFGTWKSFVFVCRFLSMTKTLPGTLKANQIKPIPGTLKNNHFFNGMLGKTTIFFNVMIWNSSSKWSKHIFQY